MKGFTLHGLTIRPAGENDRDALVTLAICTARTNYIPFLGRDAIERWIAGGGVTDHLDTHSGTCRVAERDGDIVGFCVTKGPLIELLMVAPAHQRRGIGRVLLADAEARLFAEHAVIRLESFADNSAANAFYMSQGWQPDGMAAGQDTGFRTIGFVKRRAAPGAMIPPEGM
ncbi:MAG: GNAT family N-acetyltransferase [Deltaproteobacteria bacterium]|nr:GNAT family N-acetyltransferase [Deltaproteobacteria bacterium]